MNCGGCSAEGCWNGTKFLVTDKVTAVIAIGTGKREKLVIRTLFAHKQNRMSCPRFLLITLLQEWRVIIIQ